MKLLKSFVAVGVLVACQSAFAGWVPPGDQIQLVTNYGTTDSFNALGRSDLYVTSNYDVTGLGVVAGSEATTLVGKTATFTDIGSGDYQTFTSLGATVTPNNYGINDDWYLEFTFNVGGYATFVDNVFNQPGFSDGTLDNPAFSGGTADGIIDPIDAIVPVYTSGVFTLIYHDNKNSANDVQVLELILSDYEISGANVVFYATANYGAWFDGLTASQKTFVENFFVVEGGQTFYDAFTAEGASPFVISMRTDFNVDPNYLPLCTASDGQGNCTNVSRTTDINVTTNFKVPEPGSLALLGLGLAGLGLSLRRRKAA